MRNLTNAVVVIIGASSGIGHATALTFARRGALVVLVGRSAEALQVVAGEIEALGGTSLPLAADVARWEDIERVVNETVGRFGGIDVWVNNAAVAEWSLIEQMSPDEMRRVIEVNVLGPMYAVRAPLPHLRARRGVIIHVASALPTAPSRCCRPTPRRRRPSSRSATRCAWSCARPRRGSMW